jgi:hypothetical protein
MKTIAKYYRNKVEIEGIEVESLWELKNEKLVLVDEDDYHGVNFVEVGELFYEVDPPNLLH